MNRNRLSQLFVVGGMLVAIVAGAVAVSPAYAAKPFVNFKAKVSGTTEFTGPATFELTGSGKADHLEALKRYDYEADGILTSPTTDVLTEVLIASNGDALTIRCDQVLVEISPGVYHGTDTWTVIGGTGQFSDATGSGTGETNVDLNEGVFTKVLKGTISAPYAN